MENSTDKLSYHEEFTKIIKNRSNLLSRHTCWLTLSGLEKLDTIPWRPLLLGWSVLRSILWVCNASDTKGWMVFGFYTSLFGNRERGPLYSTAHIHVHIKQSIFTDVTGWRYPRRLPDSRPTSSEIAQEIEPRPTKASNIGIRSILCSRNPKDPKSAPVVVFIVVED